MPIPTISKPMPTPSYLMRICTYHFSTTMAKLFPPTIAVYIAKWMRKQFLAPEEVCTLKKQNMRETPAIANVVPWCCGIRAVAATPPPPTEIEENHHKCLFVALHNWYFWLGKRSATNEMKATKCLKWRQQISQIQRALLPAQAKRKRRQLQASEGMRWGRHA